MAKTYTEELAEWVKKRKEKRPRQDLAAVAFMAVREDVKAAIEAGYAQKTIWAHLHEIGKIPYRYETFLKHVRKHIKEAKREEGPESAKVTPDNPTKAAVGREKDTKPTKKEGFTFDATPKKEDLI
ncbi:TraK family protein [Thiolapillus sp.]|uniref:TraK family protein n=1 Tax=Thiolapillus sp. TaxID=2017437 RepID=UPI0025FE2131|nr:TraK family protein [Thiolapillus sp.]